MNSKSINNIKCGYFEPIIKVGEFTFYDKINLIGIIVLGIIYISLISIYSSELNINLNNNKININISFIGLLLNLFLSSFITTYILREYEISINNLVVISVISFIIILVYYSKTYYNNNIDNFVHFSHIVFPLLSTLFFIIQYTWIKLQNN